MRDIDNIVEAMKAYAGSALRKAAETVRNVRRCEAKLIEALNMLVMHQPGLAKDLSVTGKRIMVAFGSSVGLCGAFNDKISDHLDVLANDDDALLITGNRLQSITEARKIAHFEHFEAPTSLEGIKDALQEILSCIKSLYDRKEYFSLVLVFTVVTDNQTEIVAEQVLPPDLGDFPAEQNAEQTLLLYEDPATVFSGILDELLATTLYRCYVESLQGENWYRLRAMEAASENLNQRIFELGALQNYLRQEEVTEEMLEILGGGFFYR